MKKIFSILLLILLLSTLLLTVGCSCGGTGNDSGSNNSMSWQENYDLGIRLLSEGNYEEAILAFQAAIQIDPKREETYIYLINSHIGIGDYEAAASVLAQGREQIGQSVAFDRLQENLDFLQSNIVGIRISNFHFDMNAYLAGQETEFLVTVVYCCPDNTDCVLMIGANTVEPHSFRMLNEDWPVTGKGTYSFHVSFAPVHWDESAFGIYVNLSEADHSDTWTPFASDTLYIDASGNITQNNFGSIYDGPDAEWDDPYNDPEHPLVELFAADPDAGLSIEELTLFGTPIAGLSLEDAAVIAQQNGFPGNTTTDGDFTTFFAFYQNDSSPGISMSRRHPATSPAVEYITYMHFLDQDDAGNPIRDDESQPVWIGIGSIHTYDTLEQVLSSLGYSYSHEIASLIHDILMLPGEDAQFQLQKLWEWGWCCNTNGISISPDTDLVDGWDFSWYDSDPATGQTYSVRFTFDVATDCLTDVYISVY